MIDHRNQFYNYNARSIMNGRVTVQGENWSTTLSGRRIGSIPIARQTDEFADEDSYFHEKVERLDPYTTFNFTASYQVSENFRVLGQVKSLFNPRPPKDETHIGWPYYNGFVYGGASEGRSVHVDLSYRF